MIPSDIEKSSPIAFIRETEFKQLIQNSIDHIVETEQSVKADIAAVAKSCLQDIKTIGDSLSRAKTIRRIFEKLVDDFVFNKTIFLSKYEDWIKSCLEENSENKRKELENHSNEEVKVIDDIIDLTGSPVRKRRKIDLQFNADSVVNLIDGVIPSTSMVNKNESVNAETNLRNESKFEEGDAEMADILHHEENLVSSSNIHDIIEIDEDTTHVKSSCSSPAEDNQNIIEIDEDTTHVKSSCSSPAEDNQDIIEIDEDTTHVKSSCSSPAEDNQDIIDIDEDTTHDCCSSPAKDNKLNVLPQITSESIEHYEKSSINADVEAQENIKLALTPESINDIHIDCETEIVIENSRSDVLHSENHIIEEERTVVCSSLSSLTKDIQTNTFPQPTLAAEKECNAQKKIEEYENSLISSVKGPKLELTPESINDIQLNLEPQNTVGDNSQSTPERPEINNENEEIRNNTVQEQETRDAECNNMLVDDDSDSDTKGTVIIGNNDTSLQDLDDLHLNEEEGELSVVFSNLSRSSKESIHEAANSDPEVLEVVEDENVINTSNILTNQQDIQTTSASFLLKEASIKLEKLNLDSPNIKKLLKRKDKTDSSSDEDPCSRINRNKKNETAEEREEREFNRLLNLTCLERERKRPRRISYSGTDSDHEKPAITSKDKMKYKKLSQENPSVALEVGDNDSTDKASDYSSDDDGNEISKVNSFLKQSFGTEDIQEHFLDKKEMMEEFLNAYESSEFESGDELGQVLMEAEGENKKKPKRIQKPRSSSSDSEKSSEDFKNVSNRKKKKKIKDNILGFRLSDSEEEETIKIKKRVKSKRRRIQKPRSSSDSEDNILGSRLSDSEKDEAVNKVSENLETIKKKKRVKRKSISKSDIGSNDDGDSDVLIEAFNTVQNITKSSNSDSSTDSEEELSTKSKNNELENRQARKLIPLDQIPDEHKRRGRPVGRRNIRRVIGDLEITEDTKRAAETEEYRYKRIMERKKEYDIMHSESPYTSKLVLDFDKVTKEELLIVNEKLVRHLKPHQIEGIKFMWNCCFESLLQTKESEGSGCILAHNMGLGKTLQVIALVHTLLTNKVTGIESVMIVCPKNVVSNWLDEFYIWLKDVDTVKAKVQLYCLDDTSNVKKMDMVDKWQNKGGVLIISYDSLRAFCTSEKYSQEEKEKLYEQLCQGPQLVVCDEGHKIKNDSTKVSLTLNSVKTKRRIVLTGTPLQNNLEEYYCMTNFVKPRLLGTKNEFKNQFQNPITNGQYDDSTPHDVQVMKWRSYILNKRLKGCVQRYSIEHLRPFLPAKLEYVVMLRLTNWQKDMYTFYLSDIYGKHYMSKKLLSARYFFQNILSHASVVYERELKHLLQEMKNSAKRYQDVLENQQHWSTKLTVLSKKELVVSGKELNGKDFNLRKLPHEIALPRKSEFKALYDYTNKYKEAQKIISSRELLLIRLHPETEEDDRVYKEIFQDLTEKKVSAGSDKTIELVKSFDIIPVKSSEGLPEELKPLLQEPFEEQIHEDFLLAVIVCVVTQCDLEEKISVPHSINNMDVNFNFNEVPKFEDIKNLPNPPWWIQKMELTQMTNLESSNKMVLLFDVLEQCEKNGEKLLIFTQSLDTINCITTLMDLKNPNKWKLGTDYFIIHGKTQQSKRNKYIKTFNDTKKPKARLFLISTRAGSLGINLIGANRCIIFDVSWNPSDDLQSIFRLYRLGQNKPCFVYRFVGAGTLEEKVYNRQVNKLSLALRVVDEKAISRHYKSEDLYELFKFIDYDGQTVDYNDPKDPLLTTILRKRKDLVYNIVEFDSLLENKVEEELNEDEKAQAIDHFEDENKRNVERKNFGEKKEKNTKQNEAMNNVLKGIVSELIRSTENTDQNDAVESSVRENNELDYTTQNPQKSPLQSAQNSPLQSIQRSSLQSVQNGPLQIIQKSPLQNTQKSPLQNAQKSPLQNTQKSPLQNNSRAPRQLVAIDPYQPSTSRDRI